MKTENVNFLDENLARINKALFKTLPEKEISRVTEAIHYSVMNGGKRIRPQIILLLCEMLEVEITSNNVDLIAAAGELIHYSQFMMIYLQWTMMTIEEAIELS